MAKDYQHNSPINNWDVAKEHLECYLQEHHELNRRVAITCKQLFELIRATTLPIDDYSLPSPRHGGRMIFWVGAWRVEVAASVILDKVCITFDFFGNFPAIGGWEFIGSRNDHFMFYWDEQDGSNGVFPEQVNAYLRRLCGNPT